MILDGTLPPIDAVIYLDSGWEPNYVLHYATYLRHLCHEHKIPFLHTKGPSIRDDLNNVIHARTTNQPYKHLSIPLFTLDENGKRGQLPRRCTRAFRLAPLFKTLRSQIIPPQSQNGNPKPWIKVLLGITTDEKHRAKPSREKWKINAFPLLDLRADRHDCISYLSTHNHPIPYRSSCVCCPYRSNDGWATLKKLDPENWRAACDLDYAVRNLSRRHTQLFLHQSRIALELATAFDNPLPIMP